jgi:hypothetical protein
MKGQRGRQRGERHIRLPYWLLRSPAWLALSPNGKAALLHLWECHNGTNNGQIVYAVRAAEKIGLSQYQAARALKEAVELGFLRIARDSAFTLKSKKARLWEITAEPVNGAPATKDFMRWTSPLASPIDRRKNPNKRRRDPGKSKTQLHQCNAQSHQCNRDPEKALKNTRSVAPVQPSEAKSTPSQLHQCNTSISTMGAASDTLVPDLLPSSPKPDLALAKKKRRAVQFGETAFLERTRR